MKKLWDNIKSCFGDNRGISTVEVILLLVDI